MKKSISFISILFLCVFCAFSQFNYNIESPLAKDSFRTGVESYSKGFYAEALASFEKTVSLIPSDPLSLYWLGKTYYKLGLSNTAWTMWQEAIDTSSSTFVQNRLEIFGAYADPENILQEERYVEVSTINGKKNKQTYFLRPTWIEPQNDGSTWVVSHGTNAIVKFNANGTIINSLNAGSIGFDRPFSCTLLSDNTMFVSEFQSDRIAIISPQGKILSYAGEKSNNDFLSGPQYMTHDEYDFVYVVDVGYAEVIKYSKDGKRILSFGKKTYDFDGFSLPTGIAYYENSIYVADVVKKQIFAFDTYGNFIKTIECGELLAPEGIRCLSDGRILVADRNRVVLVDPKEENYIVLYQSTNKRAKITSAAFDANGDLLVSDFDSSDITYLSDPVTRYSGLVLDVSRVYSDNFPLVSFDLSVKDRRGRALVGLSSGNFYVSERVTTKTRKLEGDIPVDVLSSTIKPATNTTLVSSLDSSKGMDLIFLLEASENMSNNKIIARDVASELYSYLDQSSSSASLILAGKTPEPASEKNQKAITNSILNFKSSSKWRLDSGIRLSAGNLCQSALRRSIIFITTGDSNDDELKNASLSELASLLNANRISFYAVVIGRTSNVSDSIRYLVENTGGSILASDRPDGLKKIITDIENKPTGVYRLSFDASSEDGFGYDYLSFAVEVYLRDKSGKDETGYFAPLR